MSKVLVDPDALEEAAKWLEVHSSSSGSAEAFAAEALREAIAQPAEAEGVDFGFDDRSVKVSQEAYSIFLEREQHHLAALSAVTAERDRIENELEETELRALKFFHRFSAATDLGRELREALELIEKSADGEQCRQIAYDALEPFRARAAMAAKEA